ncbi:hypothetical protein [Nocardia fluminea]|uniref:hypothetical protein n=1 Tax=Nocardia fluminea TaxID=134984 RepID=UPI003D14BD9E
MTERLRADFSASRARIERATRLRTEIADILKNQSEGRFNVTRQQRGSRVVLEATYETHPDLAVIFGDWLANVRAVLDYAIYQLAIQDTQRNPPSHQGARMFPIKKTVEEFDRARTSDALRGLSPATMRAIENMQPYHTSYGAEGNGILWLHDLARKDRHRRPFVMGARITEFRAHVPYPQSQLVIEHKIYDPDRISGLVGPGERLVLAEFHCSSVSDAKRLQNQIEVWITQTLEVLDWFRESHTAGIAANIRNDSLEDRMKFIERYMRLAIDQFENEMPENSVPLEYEAGGE